MRSGTASALRNACAACAVVGGTISCQATSLQEHWTCDFDATEARPLDNAAAPFDDAGSLPASDCMTTCGAPVTSCKRILIDASEVGALCPVCTF
jgi:hypothetical protein